MNEDTFNNATLIKALEEVDENLAIQLVSEPNLDPKELSAVIECMLMGKIVNKTTKEPLQFSKRVVMAAIRNRFNQIEREQNQELK